MAPLEPVRLTQTEVARSALSAADAYVQKIVASRVSRATSGLDPAEGLQALAARRQELEHEVDEQVLVARHAGLSFVAIGRALGVTKQAAQQRYQQAAVSAAVKHVSEQMNRGELRWPEAEEEVDHG